MQLVWKEGGCELNPLRNMWLLGTQAMLMSARKFGESDTGFCVQCVELEEEKQLMSFISKMAT